MDVLPTAILTLSVSVYFWNKLLPRVWYIPLVFIPLLGLRLGLPQLFSGSTAINIGYLITGIMIFLPLIFYLYRTSFRDWQDIFLSILMLVFALVFRERDKALIEWLPMGSHFIWHILSGVGAYFLAKYLYKLRRFELTQPLPL
jgi:hypothetical protein